MTYVMLGGKDRASEVVFAGPDGSEVLRITYQNPRWKTTEYRLLIKTIDRAIKRHSKLVDGRHTVRAVEKALS